MTRADIINTFIQKRGFKSYLEIGVDRHECFDAVKAKIKESVAPNPRACPTHLMYSDEFWKKNTEKYDIIFIDGLHHGDQVYRDILGAIKHTARNDSVVVLHDCNPPNVIAGRHNLKDFNKGGWNGDVWTGFTYYRLHSSYLCYTVDTDEGCGVIDLSATTQKIELPQNIWNIYNTVKPEDVCYLSYELLNDYRTELLGLVGGIIYE